MYNRRDYQRDYQQIFYKLYRKKNKIIPFILRIKPLLKFFFLMMKNEWTNLK